MAILPWCDNGGTSPEHGVGTKVREAAYTILVATWDWSFKSRSCGLWRRFGGPCYVSLHPTTNQKTSTWAFTALKTSNLAWGWRIRKKMKSNMWRLRGASLMAILLVSQLKRLESVGCDRWVPKYEGVSKSFWTGHLESELQMVQLFATRCSCIAILWINLINFAAITLCVASQRVFIVVTMFIYRPSPETFGYTLVCGRKHLCPILRQNLAFDWRNWGEITKNHTENRIQDFLNTKHECWPIDRHVATVSIDLPAPCRDVASNRFKLCKQINGFPLRWRG
jgi:hypothetical protein